MSQQHHSTHSWHADPAKVLAFRLRRLRIGDDCPIPDALGGGLVWRKEIQTYRVYRYGALFVKQFVRQDGADGAPLWQVVHHWLVTPPARLDEVG